MHESFEPLVWQEIVKERDREELPFLRYFEEIGKIEKPEEGQGGKE